MASTSEIGGAIVRVGNSTPQHLGREVREHPIICIQVAIFITIIVSVGTLVACYLLRCTQGLSYKLLSISPTPLSAATKKLIYIALPVAVGSLSGVAAYKYLMRVFSLFEKNIGIFHLECSNIFFNWHYAKFQQYLYTAASAPCEESWFISSVQAGDTPLHTASRSGNRPLVAKILETAESDLTAEQFQTYINHKNVDEKRAIDLAQNNSGIQALLDRFARNSAIG